MTDVLCTIRSGEARICCQYSTIVAGISVRFDGYCITFSGGPIRGADLHIDIWAADGK